jgi:nucleoside-diphosphate-sugar epimerase
VATLIFGLGYLGAALAGALAGERRPVVGMDNGFSTDWPALESLAAGSAGMLRILRGDVRRQADVDAAYRAAHPVDTVYLLAAQASAHPDAAPAAYTEETNLRGARLVLEGALRYGAPPVVVGSSFHVYGAAPVGMVAEDHPYGIVGDLAHLSKIYVEKLGEMFAARYGLPVAPVRLGIVHGVGPVMKRDLRFVTVPHAFCLRALAGQPLEVHAGGLRPLGFVHLDDAVRALLLAASGRGYAPANAAGEVATVLDVAGLVQRAAQAIGLAPDVRVHDDRRPSPPLQAAPFTVVSRLERLGWRPQRDLATSIPEVLAWYRAGAAVPRELQGPGGEKDPGNAARAGRGAISTTIQAGAAP